MRANNVKQQHGSTETHHICPDSRGISGIAINNFPVKQRRNLKDSEMLI